MNDTKHRGQQPHQQSVTNVRTVPTGVAGGIDCLDMTRGRGPCGPRPRLHVIFKELQETSQLIVITRQKRTMEIADALYGVTMRDGVTTVVSQRLAD